MTAQHEQSQEDSNKHARLHREKRPGGLGPTQRATENRVKLGVGEVPLIPWGRACQLGVQCHTVSPDVQVTYGLTGYVYKHTHGMCAHK